MLSVDAVERVFNTYLRSSWKFHQASAVSTCLVLAASFGDIGVQGDQGLAIHVDKRQKNENKESDFQQRKLKKTYSDRDSTKC
ncbi:hypothetical protein CHS0354_010557 [Potamilus streckersoni]|uniref:Uncharacterized protein n=1 Tax=Potamilus streckersoni TaxID=2493646 RepID=A0AAE0S600_9BIVA|nr:hypothetical protein CHS0354_010557 [Potamilus streckersoni]